MNVQKTIIEYQIEGQYTLTQQYTHIHTIHNYTHNIHNKSYIIHTRICRSIVISNQRIFRMRVNKLCNHADIFYRR